jgi:hypothetical protein
MALHAAQQAMILCDPDQAVMAFAGIVAALSLTYMR